MKRPLARSTLCTMLLKQCTREILPWSWLSTVSYFRAVCRRSNQFISFFFVSTAAAMAFLKSRKQIDTIYLFGKAKYV